VEPLKRKNGPPNSFVERIAWGAKIIMADFFNRIGHLFFSLIPSNNYHDKYSQQ
jgi:hypothetical protein